MGGVGPTRYSLGGDLSVAAAAASDPRPTTGALLARLCAGKGSASNARISTRGSRRPSKRWPHSSVISLSIFLAPRGQAERAQRLIARPLDLNGTLGRVQAGHQVALESFEEVS